MREIMKISFLPIFCAFCTACLFDAEAASSVRSFSGTNTYNSASSAAAARSGSAGNIARAASLRTTSGTATTSGSGTANTSDAARTASNSSTARLSIGSYLKSGTSTSGGSSIKNQTAGAGSTSTILEQIDLIEQHITNLQDADDDRYTKKETDDLLDEKQDVLTPGDNITIENGVISSIVVNGREVLIQNNGTHIQWKYDDATSTWEDLIPLADLVGPQGPQGIQGPQGEVGATPDLTGYMTSEQIHNAIAIAIANAAGNYATVAQGAKADSALQPGAPSDGSDYVLVINNGTQSWYKVAY